MYTYLYDSFVSEQKYAKTIAAIETRLTDLGLQGRIDRISVFKNPKEILYEAVRRDSKTVVIVGNDDTVRKTFEVIPNFDLTFAIIPVGSPCRIAQFFGIPEGEAACDVLSARIIGKIDIAKINSKYFFSNIAVSQTSARMMCNESYTIAPQNVGSVYLQNLPFQADSFEAPRKSNPCDGVLDLYVATPPTSAFGKVRWWLGGQGNFSKDRISVIPIKKLNIKSDKPLRISVDGAIMENSEFNIEIIPQKLRMITGKERQF